jgi:hypothetical protein
MEVVDDDDEENYDRYWRLDQEFLQALNVEQWHNEVMKLISSKKKRISFFAIKFNTSHQTTLEEKGSFSFLRNILSIYGRHSRYVNQLGRLETLTNHIKRLHFFLNVPL